MNLDIFNLPDPSGRMRKESFIFKNYKDEYDYIIKNINADVSFKEKVYMLINNLKSVPRCKNSNCNNLVKFKNSSIGYLEYCSRKCVSSDPKIKSMKEDSSIKKYGTKFPSQSNDVKDKIIKTNNIKYGGNSPMSNSEIRKKSKDTLASNYGVDNPSRSNEISVKRIESFKCSGYRSSYRKTSLLKYGVEHPWMNKEIHKKTIDFFYKSYRDRVISKISGDYDLLSIDKTPSTLMKFRCNKCNCDFDILPYQFYYRINSNNPICTSCYPISENSSISQVELYNFIRENYNGVIVQNDKVKIKPYEIDIYLPELEIGFEFNGVFWHSDKFKDDKYHFKKHVASDNNNIKIYTIWEDDWNIKTEICKSFILNKISKSIKIGARKTRIMEVGYLDSKTFLENNHFQGDVKSSVRIGLYYKDELVSLMTFSRLRLPLVRNAYKNKDKNINIWELTRFCNKLNHTVVGGSSRLLNYFILKYSPKEIQTYSDNLISNGDMYQRLGFEYVHTSNPGYWYVVNGIRKHRFNWRKDRLVKMGYDVNKTESEIMGELGYYKIYNAGNKKWIMRFADKWNIKNTEEN